MPYIFAREVRSGGTTKSVSMKDAHAKWVGQARLIVPCFFYAEHIAWL